MERVLRGQVILAGLGAVAFVGDAIVLIRPGPQVDELAALTAEGTPA